MHLPDVVAELMVQELPVLAPPRRFVPVVDAGLEGRRRVLVIGRPLPIRDALELTALCDLDGPLPTLAEALAALAGGVYDAVIVSASVTDEADGVRFVRVVKTGDPPAGFEQVWTDYSRIPFIIPPLEGDDEYLVFESAESWFLGHSSEVSFARAVRMTLRRSRHPRRRD